MKKVFFMAVAVALTLASCGTRTPGNAADNDSTATENVDSTAEAGEVSAALSDDSKATVENLTAQLKKAIEAKDSKAAITTLANLQTIYKNLVSEGKLDEAKAYGQSIKQFVSENAESIKNAANGNTTINQLVEGVKNLPTSASTTAEEAKAAIGSEITSLATPAIAKGQSAVKTAEAAAAAVKNAPTTVKEAASNAVNKAVDNAKESAKTKAEEKVNEAKKKASDAVNDAASKAIKGLLN